MNLAKIFFFHLVMLHVYTTVCAYLYQKYAFHMFQDSNFTCFLHKAHGSVIQNGSELSCGRFCGNVNSKDSCFVCLKSTQSEADELKRWSDDLPHIVDIWLDQQHLPGFYYLGYGALESIGMVDISPKSSFVDLTPIPYRSQLVSFYFNAGELGRKLKFGTFRRYNNDKCNGRISHMCWDGMNTILLITLWKKGITLDLSGTSMDF